MKYKTEMEFCEDVTELLLGIIHGTGRNVIAIPEVPHDYYSNDHIDMMLLDIKNLEMLFIEYKLNNPSKLDSQIKNRNDKGLNCIGIINTKTKYLPDPYGCNVNDLFGYTGLDIELENLAERLNSKYTWKSIFYNGLVYYWAYKNNTTNLNGGFRDGKRIMFAAVYKQAIRNLHKEYGQLDFILTHTALGCVYGLAQSKKYYRQVIQELKTKD